MDSKLVEEVEKFFATIKAEGPIFPRYEKSLHLLQRCLESLRWKYSPEEPTESGDYLVETVDQYGDEGFEILYYKTSKAFGNKWCLGSGYTLVRWLPIPQ